MIRNALQLKIPQDSYDANPFLQALRDIEFGQLTVITPERARLEFKGRQPGPVATMLLRDWGVFDELVGRGEIGFAEAYIDGRWDSSDLTELLTWGLVNNARLEQFFHGKPFYAAWQRIKAMLRENTISGSRRNIMEHYDLGNDFYALWLDKSMTYSCGLFQDDPERSLEEAQQAKYQRLIGKLGAVPGQHILEIGCGWGGFAIAAAKQGLKVTGITISQAQAEYARRRVAEEGLSSQVSIVLRDYREMDGMFDHIVSIGMFEHVGEAYWPHYFRAVKSRLSPQGIAMVQAITIDDHLFETLHGYTGFIETYIFPGGMLPSRARFKQAAEREGLACREMFTFGQDYARTLAHWHERFVMHQGDVLNMGYDERFLRIWNFYLCSCRASFLSYRTNVMQAQLIHG